MRPVVAFGVDRGPWCPSFGPVAMRGSVRPLVECVVDGPPDYRGRVRARVRVRGRVRVHACARTRVKVQVTSRETRHAIRYVSLVYSTLPNSLETRG